MNINLDKEQLEALLCGEMIETGGHKIALTRIGIDAIEEMIEYAKQKQTKAVAIDGKTGKYLTPKDLEDGSET